MYSYEERMTSAATAITRKWKKTLKLSTWIMFQKAEPGYCDINKVAANAVSVPSSATMPRSFWLRCSSTRGSSPITIMPKMESTISGRKRM